MKADQLWEERLAAPARAAVLYRRVVTQHPDAAAERVYRSLPGADPARAHAVARALERLDRDRARARWRWAAWLAIAACTLGLAGALRRAERSWRDAAPALSRPPIELLYMIPVAASFALGAVTSNQAIGRAVGFILAGSLLMTWLSGAASRAHHRRHAGVTLARAATHALTAATCIAAICYVAVTRDHVLDFVLETWRQGHER